MSKNTLNAFYNLCIIFGFAIIIQSCKGKNNLETGSWRAELATESGVTIPFNFEVVDSAGQKNIVLINGEERFKATSFKQSGDSITISVPLFHSEIKAKINEGEMQGEWIKHLVERDVAMLFSAKPDISWRFNPKPSISSYDVTGRWSSVFVKSETKDSTFTVAEFVQNGQNVTGTFLSSTGDYRFLDGIIDGDSLFLSRFDGGSAYLFTAKVESNDRISGGKLYAGLKTVNLWSAKRNETAVLPDAYTLTTLKPGIDKISFTFPNLDGKKISLDDERYKNKVVVIQMLGSWCPNCMDETAYLQTLYPKKHAKGLEIIGLAYERTADFDKAKKRVENLKSRFQIPYELLLTGYTSDKDEPIKSLPMLANFSAFPTTFVIDKKGIVRKIHTGFSGPGTGEHYQKFQTEFETTIDSLLAE